MSNNPKLSAHLNKTLVYGVFVAITKDTRLWRHSTVAPDYSGLTNDGKEIIVGIVEELMRKVDSCEYALLDDRAKELTMGILKE